MTKSVSATEMAGTVETAGAERSINSAMPKSFIPASAVAWAGGPGGHSSASNTWPSETILHGRLAIDSRPRNQHRAAASSAAEVVG